MRITKLSIKNYKNLQDFSWELNADYPVAVIVGKNGSGKTNLLEAIIHIFQDLQLYSEERRNNSLPPFEFELVYQHGEDNDDEIIIRNYGKLEITKNGEKVPLGQLETLRQDAFKGKDILPKSIFVYYAGTSNRLRDVTAKSVSQYAKSYRQTDLQHSVSQPLFYYEPIHYRVIFLTLLLSALSDIKDDFLANELGIGELESAAFSLVRRSGDSDFANAHVALQRIIQFIRGVAEAESEERNTVKFTVSGNRLRDDFLESFSGEGDFFQQLNNLALTDILSNVEICFRKSDGQPLEFADLSEGEWQRIVICGTMEIFRGQEILFLLDEPDTFAHPRWQWDFVPDLKKAIGENKNMQAIFITHSPLVLSSVEKNAFFMEAGQIHPVQENFGQDANMSLANMGVSPQMEQVADDFQLYYSLIKDGQGESERALAERARLEGIYGLNHEKFDHADILFPLYK
jgi:predicted ATPase